MHRSMIAGALAVAALALAGCSGTGNFDVQQTEPFRVQLEGSPQTVQVSESDSSAKEVVIVTCQEPCDDASCSDPCDGAVNVKVHVTPAAASACVIKVTIKDKVTGEVLETREVDASGSGSGSSSTTATGNGTNGTTTVTQTETQTQTVSSATVVQDIVVNVKGNHNIVVLTQAIEGSASVQVSAAHATGNGEADAGTTSSVTASGSASVSSTSSASQTNSTSPP